MTIAAAVTNPFVPLLSLAGLGLNEGKVYVGLPNQDPVTNPQAVYWDAGLTTPATQPLTVTGGYITRTGTPAQAFTLGNYSLTVKDKNGVQVFTIANTGAASYTPFLPESYGAKGDYSQLDTVAVQGAINACSAAGGGTVQLTGRYKVGNLTVPAKVLLQGIVPYPLAETSVTSYPDYYTYPSALRLTSGATVTVQAGAGIDKALVIRDGLPLITSAGQSTTANLQALVAAFSGNGITCPDPEVKLTNLLVLGHALGIYIGDTGTNIGRTIVENVWADNKSGMFLTNSFDVCRVSNVHMWGFLTSYQSGPSGYADANWRNGYGFYVSAHNDWSIFEGCFAYGYGALADGNANWIFGGCSDIRVTNWGSDSAGDKAGVTGVIVTGATSALLLENGHLQNGNGIGITVNTSATAGVAATVKLTNNIISAKACGVQVTTGNILSHGNTFNACDIAYQILASSSLSQLWGDEFQTVPTKYSVNPLTLSTVFINGWTFPFSFTPTITAPSATGATFGSISATGRYGPGKFSVEAVFTVTAGGSGGGPINFAIPNTVTGVTATGVANQTLPGSCPAFGLASAVIGVGATTITISKYDNSTALGTGNVISISGAYDIAA